MAEEPHDLVLEHLRFIRADVATLRDDMREMRTRQAAVEDMFSFLVSAVTRMQHSLDRLTDRVERIEKRLGLVDQPA
jgi:predicted nuclease with TOPRIM domain